MSQEQEKIESLSQQLTAADKRVVALERENARLRRRLGELAAEREETAEVV